MLGLTELADLLRRVQIAVIPSYLDYNVIPLIKARFSQIRGALGLFLHVHVHAYMYLLYVQIPQTVASLGPLGYEYYRKL